MDRVTDVEGPPSKKIKTDIDIFNELLDEIDPPADWDTGDDSEYSDCEYTSDDSEKENQVI